MAVSPFTAWSRRVMYSLRIFSTQSCGPFNAATAAFCTNDVAFDVDWLCSFCIAEMTGAGASAYPKRHPVIAYVFESEPMITMCSRYCRNELTEKRRPV